jgi:hypothetical protein
MGMKRNNVYLKKQINIGIFYFVKIFWCSSDKVNGRGEVIKSGDDKFPSPFGLSVGLKIDDLETEVEGLSQDTPFDFGTLCLRSGRTGLGS